MDLQLGELRKQQKKWKSAARCLDDFSAHKLSRGNAIKRLKKLSVMGSEDKELPDASMSGTYRLESRALAPDIAELKSQLKELLEQHEGMRRLRQEFINDRNVISIFDSELSRTCGFLPDVLTQDLIIVKTCYFKILSDIIHDGFVFNGNHYVCYTASAGQIRTKRTVFINADVLMRHSDSLMCGLSVDQINAMGGINITKFLAYLALSNSATDRWDGFDIDRCIVVDDMESMVRGTVDYIDDKTYEITRQEMDIPITQTDGCGMILPSVSKKNFMIRLPWVKGLLSPFPFDKFIREANRREPGVNHGLVKDIYGKEYDILADNIQIIFTKGQFKTWKYYASFYVYKELFKKHGCHAGICNIEPDVFDKAKINYQMLQTLVDLTDDELKHISRFTIDKLHKLSYNRETMLRVFGATDGNTRRNSFQTCLKIYPELLQDEYCRDTLRQIKKSIEKEAVAGRLDINGYYSFVIPDLYAFCQWLFLGEENPQGLLCDGDVYFRVLPSGKDIACLRSPHLYREWAIRKNASGIDGELNRWFVTDGVYVSCQDLISRILQMDFDGDKLLVIDDDVVISAAKRNMEGIVPLYYLGLKGPAQEITPKNIYDSLVWAYTSCNIGIVSNEITKIWSGDSEIDLDLVKYLCQDNNLVIDAAKNLYRPPRPDFLVKRLKPYTKNKVPHFFIEAKDKLEHQVAPMNNSCVNRLRRVIPKLRLNFSDEQLGTFDWRMLASTEFIPSNEISKKIVDIYKETSSNMPFSFNRDNNDTNVYYLCGKLRSTLLSVYNDEDYIVDVLVKRLFHETKTKNKNVFWECYGDVVLRNLQNNIDKNLSMCIHCGKRFRKDSPRHEMCKKCSAKQRRQQKALSEKRRRKRGHFGNSLQDTAV